MYGGVFNDCLDGWGTRFYPHLVLPEGNEQTVRNLRSVDDFLRHPVLWGDLYALSLFLRVGSDCRVKVSKMWHLFLGVLLNVFGTAIMFVSNAWLTYQTSPAIMGPKPAHEAIPLHDESGAFIGTLWQAINNYTWMPVNIHRLIGNIAFGGAIVGAYAAFRFLAAKTQEDRAHYDWMGYTGNFIALCGLIPLPFAGYWLGREIYMFNQTMGINMMGSLFSWLFIIQAVMIGVLFIGANYYLWSGMTRIAGGERYARFRPYMIAIIVLSVAVWMTPRTLIVTPTELAAMGGPNHPLVGLFGLMTAKNTVVNLIILTTFLSFLFYRRSGKTPTVGWSKAGNIIIAAIFGLAVAGIVIIGIAGFTVPSEYRVNVLTPVQVLIALAVMILVTAIDLIMYRKAMRSSEINWGQMTDRSQYVLIYSPLLLLH